MPRAFRSSCSSSCPGGSPCPNFCRRGPVVTIARAVVGTGVYDRRVAEAAARRAHAAARDGERWVVMAREEFGGQISGRTTCDLINMALAEVRRGPLVEGNGAQVPEVDLTAPLPERRKQAGKRARALLLGTPLVDDPAHRAAFAGMVSTLLNELQEHSRGIHPQFAEAQNERLAYLAPMIAAEITALCRDAVEPDDPDDAERALGDLRHFLARRIHNREHIDHATGDSRSALLHRMADETRTALLDIAPDMIERLVAVAVALDPETPARDNINAALVIAREALQEPPRNGTGTDPEICGNGRDPSVASAHEDIVQYPGRGRMLRPRIESEPA